MSDYLKIDSLDVSNFKGIRKIHLDINGRSFLIVGKNESYKSTLIQAILSPLSTKHVPFVPVTTGEEQAKIELVLKGQVGGVPRTYQLEMYFNSSNNKGRLVLFDETGAKVSAPSTFIKNLVGNISFDIMEFLNSDKAKKIKILRELSGKDKDIFEVDKKIKEATDKKAYSETQMSEIEGFISQNNVTPELIKKYENPIPLEEIQQQLSQVNAKRDNYNKVKNRIEANNTEKSRIDDRIAQITEEYNKLTQRKSEIETENNNCEVWLQENVLPSSDEIMNSMNEAIAHNKEHERIRGLREKHAKIQELHAAVILQTNEIKKLKAEKDRIISESNLPVKGLTWTDSEILIDGLPLDETQINKSRIFDIGVDITMAMNPTLKTIFLHDGSLFDDEHLQAVLKKVENNGYNLIVEKVGNNTDIEVNFIES